MEQKQEKKTEKNFSLRCKTAKGILDIFSDDKDSLFVYAASQIKNAKKIIMKKLPEGEVIFHASHGRVKIF